MMMMRMKLWKNVATEPYYNHNGIHEEVAKNRIMRSFTNYSSVINLYFSDFLLVQLCNLQILHIVLCSGRVLFTVLLSKFMNSVLLGMCFNGMLPPLSCFNDSITWCVPFLGYKVTSQHRSCTTSTLCTVYANWLKGK